MQKDGVLEEVARLVDEIRALPAYRMARTIVVGHAVKICVLKSTAEMCRIGGWSEVVLGGIELLPPCVDEPRGNELTIRSVLKTYELEALRADVHTRCYELWCEAKKHAGGPVSAVHVEKVVDTKSGVEGALDVHVRVRFGDRSLSGEMTLLVPDEGRVCGWLSEGLLETLQSCSEDELEAARDAIEQAALIEANRWSTVGKAEEFFLYFGGKRPVAHRLGLRKPNQ